MLLPSTSTNSCSNMPQKERKPYRFSPLVPPTKKRNGKVRTFFESIRFPSTTCTVLRPFRFLSSHKWFFFFLYTTEYRRAQYFKRCCFVVFRPTPHAYGHFNGCCVVTMLVFFVSEYSCVSYLSYPPALMRTVLFCRWFTCFVCKCMLSFMFMCMHVFAGFSFSNC